MFPLLFEKAEAPVVEVPQSIPYSDRDFSVFLEIPEADLSTGIFFFSSTCSLKVAPAEKIKCKRKISLTLENVEEMINIVGGITLSSAMEIPSPAGGEIILTDGVTHIFGDLAITLLKKSDANSPLFYEIIANLTAKYTESFTRQRYFYLANTKTDISYADYYDNREKIELCHKNIYF